MRCQLHRGFVDRAVHYEDAEIISVIFLYCCGGAFPIYASTHAEIPLSLVMIAARRSF